MAHINLSIQRGQQKDHYILSNADYLGEAWLAKVNENNTTKIVRQFRCKQFKDCFKDLKIFVDRIGEVRQVSSAEGIPESDKNLLENILIKADGILPVNNAERWRSATFWNWISNDKCLIS